MVNSVCRYIFSKIVTNKNIVKIYRTSIISLLFCTLILILLGENIVKYIFIYSVIFTFSSSFYWGAYESIISSVNENGDMKKYFSINMLLLNISYVIAPTLFGFLIEKYSYQLVFVILGIVTLASIILSLFLKGIQINVKKIELNCFIKSIKNYGQMKNIIMQNVLDGLLSGGVIDVLATLIIYSNIPSELTVGWINTLIGSVSILVAIIVDKVVHEKNFKKITIPLTIIAFILAIPVTFIVKVELVVVYMIIDNIVKIVVDVIGTAKTFDLLGVVSDEKYRVDYLMIIQFVFDFGRIIGYSMILLVIVIFKDIKYLNILFLLFSSMYILRVIYINRMLKIEGSE